MYPSVPKAQDLPSAIAALNALTQIAMELATPSLPVNNLTTFQPQKLVGTPGINAAAGASPGVGSFAFDGQDGNKAEQSNWRATKVEYERIKVVNPDDDEEFVCTKRITLLEFTDQTNPSSKITFEMKALSA